MTLTPATGIFLADVERVEKKRFRHRPEIGVLIDAIATPAALADFEKLIFSAKFITNAHGILKRSGLESEETRNMVAEYRVHVALARELLGAINSLLHEAERKYFERTYLGMTPEQLERTMSLLGELSWIKNYLLDTKKTLKPL